MTITWGAKLLRRDARPYYASSDMTKLARRLALSIVLLVLGEYESRASSMLPKPARKPWSVGLYPDIERDLEGCGRLTPNSLVCDPDQLISKEQADQVS